MAPDIAVARCSVSDGAQAPGTAPGWRHAICGLVFLIVVVCYADRTNIGIVLAQTELPGIPREEKGSILSAFFSGYFCTQLLGGYLARRLGSKPTLLLAAGVWTLFDVLTPFAARLGLSPLIAARIGMGLGEGMMFPTQHCLSSYWVPSHERAFLITFMTSGQDLGSVLANVISPRLVELGVWCVFSFWGGLAVLWLLAYLALGASAPEVHTRCKRSGEALWIQQHRGCGDFNDRQLSESPLPRRLLSEPCIWGIFAGHVGVNYAWYVMLSWMPTFFKGRFQLDLADSPLILAMPYVASWAGGILGGFISDKAVGRGFRTRHVRKFMQVTGALCNAVFLQLAASASTAGQAAFWISFAAFFGKLQNAGYWVNMVDVCPETAATVMGMSNTIATIPGIIGQPITQALLNGSGGERSADAWRAVFGIGGAVAAVGAAIFALLGDDVSLDGAHRASAAPEARRSVPSPASRGIGRGGPVDGGAAESGSDSHDLSPAAQRALEGSPLNAA